MSWAAIRWLNIYTLLHSPHNCALFTVLTPPSAQYPWCDLDPGKIAPSSGYSWSQNMTTVWRPSPVRSCLATGRPSVESLGKIISQGGNWDIQPVVIKYIWNISDRRINTNWVTHNHRPAVVSIVRTGAQVDTVLWWYIRYSQADNDTASPGYMCHMLDTLSLSSSSRMLTQWKHIQFSPAAEDL